VLNRDKEGISLVTIPATPRIGRQLLLSIMGLLSSNKSQEGARKQQINAYNVVILVLLGFGSITYGYSTSIIGTTEGWL